MAPSRRARAERLEGVLGRVGPGATVGEADRWAQRGEAGCHGRTVPAASGVSGGTVESPTMFNIGGGEVIVIALIALIVLGPRPCRRRPAGRQVPGGLPADVQRLPARAPPGLQRGRPGHVGGRCVGSVPAATGEGSSAGAPPSTVPSLGQREAPAATPADQSQPRPTRQLPPRRQPRPRRQRREEGSCAKKAPQPRKHRAEVSRRPGVSRRPESAPTGRRHHMIDETVADDDARMTIWEHIAELRTASSSAPSRSSSGWRLVPGLSPDHDLPPGARSRTSSTAELPPAASCSVDPLEGFAIRMKIALYVGIGIAMPVILWQIWRFVTPGLYPHEKRYAVPFVVDRAGAVRPRRRPRLLHAAPGARVPRARSAAPTRRAVLHGRQLLHADRRT